MSEVKRYMHSDQRGAVEVHRGKYVMFADYAALQQKLDAANAERERFAVQCAAAKIAVQAAQAAGFECTLNTPAVDAFLNAVRAEGVEMVRKHPAISLCSLTHVCEEITAQLRAETDTTSSQYESLAGGK